MTIETIAIPPPEPPEGVREPFEAMMSKLTYAEKIDMLVHNVEAKMAGDMRHSMVLGLEWAAAKGKRNRKRRQSKRRCR